MCMQCDMVCGEQRDRRRTVIFPQPLTYSLTAPVVHGPNLILPIILRG